MFNIKLDKSDGSRPAYQQIIDHIEHLIRTSRLKVGDKIPPERELAEMLGAARGTVKKAYEELSRKGLIEVTQGRGSFVSAPYTPSMADRKERAGVLIAGVIDELVRFKFSYQEIKAFFDLRLLEREEALRDLAVAAVDCNPEALEIYEKQIFLLPFVNMAKFLLDDILKDPALGRRLTQFDLILTTPTHIEDLKSRYPELADKILPVAVAPARDSIIRLARLTPSQRIGVVCRSPRFFAIITRHLKEFGIPADSMAVLYDQDLEGLGDFICGLDAVIIPPGLSLISRKENLAQVQAFTERGGIVIPFDYKIEQGSLLHVEERLRGILADAAGRA
ncbi:MAG: GntR family transcriptional regulator [Candidatus Aminicenantes bacterium]|nr:GntR family transcriptional regulator [Candidatus Aminicenantes bacterium]